MPAGAATPGIGRIDPSSLIGKPESVVEPRNVALLSDAFRSGFITADDVISRVGELGKTKQKAELMGAQEAISPEQQALRAQQTAAGTAQAGVAEAQALRTQVYLKFPGVKDYDELRSMAAISEDPKTAAGEPDYAQMAVIGSRLKLQKAEKDKAILERNNIEAHYDNDARIISSVTKQGVPVDSKHVQNLDRVIASPFSAQAPGTAQTVVSPRSANVSPPGIGMNGMPLSPEESRTAPVQVAAREAEAKTRGPGAIVEPRATPAPTPVPTISAEAPAGVSPFGTPLEKGFSMGPTIAQAEKPADTVDRVLRLHTAQASLPNIDKALEIVARTEPAVGAREGSGVYEIGNRIGAFFGVRKEQYDDQQVLKMTISSKILEGAQVMKGNLSDRDVLFLKATVPQLNSSPEVWTDYLNRWRSMTRTNIDILNGKVPKPAGDLFAPKDWTESSDTAAKEKSGDLFTPVAATAAASGTSGNPLGVNTPAEAPPTVEWITAISGPSKGKVLKNPNYRPSQ